MRLRVPLKLRGKDGHGNEVETDTTTENVSVNGFLCASTADLAAHSVVEVYLGSCGEKFVGKALVLQSDGENTPIRRYEFQFIEKTGPWVLQ